MAGVNSPSAPSQVLTVLGAQGLVGQALVRHLRQSGHHVHTPPRELPPAELVAQLRGHVIYCIGLTADFRQRPWDTAQAHVGLLNTLLAQARFASLTYLSSTRVYAGSPSTTEEAALTVQPHDPEHLYHLSKLMGESLCHIAHRPERPVRVVRLSNVIATDVQADDFVHRLLREAQAHGCIRLHTALDSEKDYIALSDVVRMLERLVCGTPRHRCYNLASGQQSTHADIATRIADLTGARIEVAAHAPRLCFPPIDITRLRQEFDFVATPAVQDWAASLPQRWAAFTTHDSFDDREPHA